MKDNCKLSIGWIHYFFRIAKEVASKSKDPSTKVGAVVVNESKRILATGYNGIPIGVEDDINTYPERYDKTKQKYLCVSHAEANVIAFAASEGVALKGSTLFVTLHPCIECTKAIIMAGIKEIHCVDIDRDRSWTEHLPLAKRMLVEAGVTLFVYSSEHELK